MLGVTDDPVKIRSCPVKVSIEGGCVRTNLSSREQVKFTPRVGDDGDPVWLNRKIVSHVRRIWETSLRKDKAFGGTRLKYHVWL